MKLYQYQISCSVCGQKVFWAEKNDIACPVDATHTINAGETKIITKTGDMPLYSEHDKMEVISESRPPGTITCFTSCGDSIDSIWGGAELLWSASDTDNHIHPSPPTGMKGKLFQLTFNDDIWIKEGALYHSKAKHGSWCRMSVVCPAGSYYLDSAGIPKQAIKDTPISVYIPQHFFFGDTPMGDELNTEGCSRQPLPPGYYLQVELFMPIEDVDSNGHITLEIFRKRTCLLPGETL